MKRMAAYIMKEIQKNLDFDYLVKATALFYAYYITGNIGLTLNPISGFATLFWMPTGIALAFLFLKGYKFWPAIFLGAFFVNFTNGAPALGSSLIALGNSLEAIVGVYLLRRFNFSPSLEKLSDSVTLIFYAGILSTSISASIGTFTLFTQGLLTVSSSATWFAWWIGDFISNIIVAPFIMSWGYNPKVNLTIEKISEGLILGISVIVVSTLTFTGALGIFFKNAPFVYIIFPVLLLIAFRFKPRETTTAVFTTTVIATITTYNGFGPFAVETDLGNLIFLQAFISVIGITFLILASSQAEKRNLEQAKEEFLALATHELKTPITSIKAYTDISHQALIKKGDSKNAEIIGRMKNQIDKLSKLISDLLDLSRIDNQRLRMEQSYFDFNELVLEVIDQMQAITERNILETRLQRTKTLFADRDRLGQVMINLIGNAIKFSPKKSKITITTRVENGKILFCVKDKGIGIPTEELSRIFEKTFRGSEKETYPGLGLGLYISKEIIKRHQGRIWATSKKNDGSIFCFSIPIRESGV
jgi:signal transduction histidine kinase